MADVEQERGLTVLSPSDLSLLSHVSASFFFVCPCPSGFQLKSSGQCLQLYMIIALIAALLMRLRCFLRRRGEAGRNGARRAEGDIGDAVEKAV